VSHPRAAARLIVRVLLVAGVAMTLLLAPSMTLAQGYGSDAGVATPRPAAGEPPVIGSGDSRSDGEGPGLVGSPAAIAVGVVVLGLATAGVTLVALRIGGSRRRG
jgi:hypothetical protein